MCVTRLQTVARVQIKRVRDSSRGETGEEAILQFPGPSRPVHFLQPCRANTGIARSLVRHTVILIHTASVPQWTILESEHKTAYNQQRDLAINEST